MRIRRFNEAEALKIDDEKTTKIIEELEDFLAQMKDRQSSTDEMLNTLDEYSNPSKKGNDQVDDTIAALREVKKSVDQAIDKLDTALQNMNSYKEEGSEYLYTETKPKV
jgi:ABC-type transporter Mla subunit MlaD